MERRRRGLNVDHGWLEDFLAVADCLHFARAAERRHVTQSAMSRRIQSLENWVGVPLFSRDTHRLLLTPAGARFRDTASDIVRKLAAGREEARAVADRASGAIRIASTHALCTTFFPGWLQPLERSEPVGPVRLMADTMSACEAMMLRGDAQFLLCHRHVSSPEVLDQQLFRGRAVDADVVLPVSAPDGRGHPLHAMPGSAEHPVPALVYDAASGIGRIVEAVRRLSLPPSWLDPRFTSHLASLLRAMALAGKGMAFLPRSLVEADLRSGTLLRAGDPVWDIEVEIRLFRPRARQDPAAERFWACIAEPSNRS